MGDGDDEKAVGIIGDTGQGVVPGQEGGQKAEEASCLDERRVRVVGGVALQISNAQE